MKSLPKALRDWIKISRSQQFECSGSKRRTRFWFSGNEAEAHSLEVPSRNECKYNVKYLNFDACRPHVSQTITIWSVSVTDVIFHIDILIYCSNSLVMLRKHVLRKRNDWTHASSGTLLSVKSLVFMMINGSQWTKKHFCHQATMQDRWVCINVEHKAFHENYFGQIFKESSVEELMRLSFYRVCTTRLGKCHRTLFCSDCTILRCVFLMAYSKTSKLK